MGYRPNRWHTSRSCPRLYIHSHHCCQWTRRYAMGRVCVFAFGAGAWAKDFALSSFNTVSICYHLYAGNAPAVELIQSEWDICKSRSEKPSDPNIYQCSVCGIDYQIEVVDCDSKGTALIITKWLDLGSGLNPNDPRWKRHSFGYSFRLENDATKSDGTLRSQFEQKSAVSLDALTHRNASLLRSYEPSSKTISEGNKATPDYRKGRMSNLFRPAWGSSSLSSILF
jgi:hypothetical protein